MVDYYFLLREFSLGAFRIPLLSGPFFGLFLPFIDLQVLQSEFFRGGQLGVHILIIDVFFHLVHQPVDEEGSHVLAHVMVVQDVLNLALQILLRNLGQNHLLVELVHLHGSSDTLSALWRNVVEDLLFQILFLDVIEHLLRVCLHGLHFVQNFFLFDCVCFLLCLIQQLEFDVLQFLGPLFVHLGLQSLDHFLWIIDQVLGLFQQVLLLFLVTEVFCAVNQGLGESL